VHHPAVLTVFMAAVLKKNLITLCMRTRVCFFKIKIFKGLFRVGPFSFSLFLLMRLYVVRCKQIHSRIHSFIRSFIYKTGATRGSADSHLFKYLFTYLRSCCECLCIVARTAKTISERILYYYWYAAVACTFDSLYHKWQQS